MVKTNAPFFQKAFETTLNYMNNPTRASSRKSTVQNSQEIKHIFTTKRNQVSKEEIFEASKNN